MNSNRHNKYNKSRIKTKTSDVDFLISLILWLFIKDDIIFADLIDIFTHILDCILISNV